MILKIKWSTEKTFLQVWNSEKNCRRQRWGKHEPARYRRQFDGCYWKSPGFFGFLRSENLGGHFFWNLFVVNAKSPKKRAQVFLHLNLKHEETNKTATATTPTTQPTTQPTTTTTTTNNNNNNNKDKPPGRNITKKKQKHQKKKKKKLKKKKESAAMVPHCFLLHDFFGLHPS